MAKSKCYKCGRLKELASNTLCVSCMNRELPIIKELKFNRLLICDLCNAYSYSKEWKKDRKKQENLILDTIKKGMKLNSVYTLKNLEVNLEKVAHETTEKKEVYMANLMLKLSYEKNFQYNKEMRFVITHTACPACQKHLGNYFEGTIQLRGRDNERYDEVEKYVFNLVETHKNVEISKVIESKTGVDLLLTNQKVMFEIMSKAHQEFGGHFEQNSRLFTKDNLTSKDLYRITTLLRLPDFNKGDILEIKGCKLLVTRTHGNKVSGVNLTTTKDQTLDFIKSSYEIVARRTEISSKTTISKVFPNLEVLNENYESVPAKNLTEKSTDTFKIGFKVTCVEYQGKNYIIKV